MGGGSLEASMVFEKLFTDLLMGQEDAGLRRLLVRKLGLMAGEDPIVSNVQSGEDGSVSVNIREGDDSATVAALSEAFDSLVDIIGYSIGPEPAFKMAVEMVSKVEKQFREPFNRLGVGEHILRGALAQRLPSGIDGLDRILGGGFPRSEMVVLLGPPGSAKYQLGFQFLSEGLNRGGGALAVLSSMSVKEMRESLSKQGVDVSACEAKGRLVTVDWYSQKSRAVVGLEEKGAVLVPSKDIANLDIALSRALDGLSFTPTRRASVDMITLALNIYNLSDVMEFVQHLKARFRQRTVVSIFVVEEGAHDERVVSTLKHTADTVLHLTGDAQTGLFLEVLSMGSGKFRSGKVAVQLSSKGMSVMDSTLDEASIISELCNIPSVTKDIAQRLIDAGYTDIQKLSGASQAELLKVDMVTETVARSIQEYTRTIEYSQSVLATRSEKWLKKAKEQADAGELRKAMKSLERAVEIDPANTSAWTELSIIKERLEKEG